MTRRSGQIGFIFAVLLIVLMGGRTIVRFGNDQSVRSTDDRRVSEAYVSSAGNSATVDHGGARAYSTTAAKPDALDPLSSLIPANRFPEDRYADWLVLEERQLADMGRDSVQRVRLIRSGGKYPVVRVESDYVRDSQGGYRLAGETVTVGDHVVVQLHESATEEALRAWVDNFGFEIREALNVPRGYLVASQPAGLETVPDLLDALAAQRWVDLVEPDYVYYLAESVTPDDAQYGDLWGMEKIAMPAVWSSRTGTGGVVVAVFDTGVLMIHEDLVANIFVNSFEIQGNGLDDDHNGYVDDISGWDFYNQDNDPTDDQGHGTHVAGTIGAMGNNGLGVAGVGWGTRILPIKMFGFNDYGVLEGTSSGAASGMYYVIELAGRGVPVRVTNHSWGTSSYSTMLADVFDLAASENILHVAAAGNGGSLDNDVTPHYPGSFTLSNVVAVANTTSGDVLSSDSHYGATTVDLAAPGRSILSTTFDGGYGYKSGTSMASPHVAGVAALLFEANPDLSFTTIKAALLDGGDVLPALAGKCVTGARLNAYGAFEQLPAALVHVPLPNVESDQESYHVELAVHPGHAFFATNEVEVLWNTTGSTNEFNVTQMLPVEDPRFEAWLPGKPEGSTVAYMIRARRANGEWLQLPEDAPGALYQFNITYPVELNVYGSPAAVGAVSPAYGAGTAPWGSTVVASAPEFTSPTNGRRWKCIGWDGGGSVPPMGTTTQAVFELRNRSFLLWRWQEQFSLSQLSEPAGVMSNVTWWSSGAFAETVDAPEVYVGDLQTKRFIGWWQDGVRKPEGLTTAVYRLENILMDAPHTVEARYLDESLDSDSDGLPDWWEHFYFNTLDYEAADDPDGDGFLNDAELADRASPLDGTSVPTGPTLAFEPLPDPLGQLPPYAMSVTVSDRVDVATVVLRWQQNGGAWQEQRLNNAGAGLFLGELNPVVAPGDTLRYQIEASDTLGYASTSALQEVTLVYPVISFSPDHYSVSHFHGEQSLFEVSVTNGGNGTWHWEATTGMDQPVASAPEGWTHHGANEQWHISSELYHSPPYAWFCGDPDGGEYNNSMDARLETPPLTLGASARMRFVHWPEMEYDGRAGMEQHYWDAAVLEITTNGTDYLPLDPVGGYPYLVTSNTASALEPNRPCLGGVTGGWHEVEVDLSAYAGETVQISFRFVSDAYVVSRGWGIDDIRITWADSWLMPERMTGEIAGGTSGTVGWKINSSGMGPGEFDAGWSLQGNDPANPTISGQVDLTVEAPPGTAFSLDTQGEDQHFVLTWQSETGLLYSLYQTEDLLIPGVLVPGYELREGGGTMVYTGVYDQAVMQFYRVTETLP